MNHPLSSSSPATRRTVVSAVVVALAAAGFLLFALGSKAADDKSAAAARPVLTVTAATPQQSQLAQRLSANGSIAAWQEASVGSEASGLKLTEVRVNVGDRVRRGQVLAVFSPLTVQAEVGQARASVMEAEANAAEAAANAQRARALEPSGALSASQINQYLTAEKTAQARVEAARATLAAQQLRLDYTQVRAPDDGVISARSATVGAVVGAGTELFRLIRQGRIEWRAEVTSAELGRLAPGTAATVTSAGGAQLLGRVRMVAPTVDPQTRLALVYVDLPPLGTGRAGAPGAALPGMFARGEFALGATPATTVPQQAVVVRDGFSYVFRVGDDNRVSQLKVATGRLAGDRIEITTGLDAGARIVTQGAGFLNNGDLVRVTTAPAGSATAPAPAASAPARQ
ncbi:MAG: efflux RND transporter periplasmic adaptor subunit [Burkholderiaceae bacterium]|nr:efflux RND transporter periplasmic adaptor subunit [Burkholderiaceae bacterium]